MLRDTNLEGKRFLYDHAKLFLLLELIRRSRELTDGEKHKYFICRRALAEHGLLNMRSKEPTEQECREYGLLMEYRTYMYSRVNQPVYQMTK